MKSKTNGEQTATKKDIQSLRIELKKGDKVLRSEILRVEEKVEVLQEGQGDIKTILDKLQNTLDGFVGNVDTLTTENALGANQTRELDVRVNGHEKRISKLESTSPAQ